MPRPLPLYIQKQKPPGPTFWVPSPRHLGFGLRSLVRQNFDYVTDHRGIAKNKGTIGYWFYGATDPHEFRSACDVAFADYHERASWEEEDDA